MEKHDNDSESINLSELDQLNLLERVVESYPGSVMAIDADTNVIFATQKTADMLGMKLEDIIGSNYLTEKENGLFTSSAGIEALKTGRITWVRSENRKNEGMFVTAIPFFSEDGHVKEVYSFSQDEKEIDLFVEWIMTRKDAVISFFNERIKKELPDPSIVASSGTMLAVLQLAKRIAPTIGIVLINGESGTGKEVLAHYIHMNSNQKDGLFLPVNCASIPEQLAESEFFGYEQGAFTGAQKNGKAGYFEIANGGTLFLDEIGELSLNLQAKLLRVIETRQIMRVGGNRQIDVSARILCATNRDLKEMVREGTFREDLYYRLNVLPLHILPLRERKEDILPLAEKFLKEFNRKNSTSKVFSDRLRNQMEEYSWPGNVRELKNIIERAVIISPHNIIDSEVVFPAGSVGGKKSAESMYTQPITPLKEALKEMERSYLERVLLQLDWDVQKVSRVLEVHPSGLYKKIKEYRLKKPESDE